MQINPTFAFTSGATQTDMTQFTNAVNTVIAYFDSVFTNVKVTLNVVFAYGEQYSSDNGSTIFYKPMPNASGSFDLGLSHTEYESQIYSTVLSQLQTKTDSLQPAAYATLPTAQSNPFANDNLWLPVAQEKALGFTPHFSVAGFDGVVGIISNEELQAGGLTADWTKAAPSSSNQYYMIGTIEHELTEVMGRDAFDGTNAINNAPSYTLMDLFRYSAQGVRQVTDGNPAYFSTDNGNHVFYYWNNPALAKGDLGDWAPSGPNGFEPTGNDSFLNNSNPGVVNEVSAFDLDLMNVLGWNLGTPVVDLTTPASITYTKMYGVAPSSGELSNLVQFDNTQYSFGTSIGVQDPIVYVYQALGQALAEASDTGSTAFKNAWGPAAIASDATFSADAYLNVFGVSGTQVQVQHFIDQVKFFESIYTASGAFGTDANRIDLLARGAVYGQMLGVKAENSAAMASAAGDDGAVPLIGVGGEHNLGHHFF
jgi:hypothetical protein